MGGGGDKKSTKGNSEGENLLSLDRGGSDTGVLIWLKPSNGTLWVHLIVCQFSLIP